MLCSYFCLVSVIGNANGAVWDSGMVVPWPETGTRSDQLLVQALSFTHVSHC